MCGAFTPEITWVLKEQSSHPRARISGRPDSEIARSTTEITGLLCANFQAPLLKYCFNAVEMFLSLLTTGLGVQVGWRLIWLCNCQVHKFLQLLSLSSSLSTDPSPESLQRPCRCGLCAGKWSVHSHESHPRRTRPVSLKNRGEQRRLGCFSSSIPQRPCPEDPDTAPLRYFGWQMAVPPHNKGLSESWG